MKYLPTIARILLGLAFTVFGLNFFFHFIPNPPAPPAAGAFAGALFATGYLFQLLKVLEVASGVALLAGRFVPLALAVLAPIIVNIIFFHAFLHPAGLLLPVVVLALELFLAFCYRDAFRPMLQARNTPKL
jgi:uncharacterized membrane protein YphA (DoxX/SURF4 family)